MPKQKTTQAVLALNLAAFGGLFKVLCASVDPTMAFIFALMALVVMIKS